MTKESSPPLEEDTEKNDGSRSHPGVYSLRRRKIKFVQQLAVDASDVPSTSFLSFFEPFFRSREKIFTPDYVHEKTLKIVIFLVLTCSLARETVHVTGKTNCQCKSCSTPANSNYLSEVLQARYRNVK
ncbi:hypothetical protein RUM43_004309 [Polyplax serrata]|uniref:Uncharacterized protein n=1 Tax=Polyplax serrata TaxID=468196 RepID=A0AAN8XPN7_POLSC